MAPVARHKMAQLFHVLLLLFLAQHVTCNPTTDPKTAPPPMPAETTDPENTNRSTPLAVKNLENGNPPNDPSKQTVPAAEVPNPAAVVKEEQENPNPPSSKTSNSDPKPPESKDPSTLEDDSSSMVCHLCQCPRSTDSDPYEIDCTSAHLDHFPKWNRFLIGTTTTAATGNGTSSLNPPKRVILKLGWNTLDSVPKVPGLDALDTLHMESNHIGWIEPFAFASLPSLRCLSLRSNAIRALHPDAFSAGAETLPVPLRVLDLSDNLLGHLDPTTFRGIADTLEELRLSGNPLQAFDAGTILALNGLHALRSLGLGRAGLSRLPMELVNPVRHLVSLDLEGNAFREVPPLLQYAGRLEELRIGGGASRIVALDAESLIGMERLRKLDVSDTTSLTCIGEGTFYPTLDLQDLNCSYNTALRYVDTEAFRDVLKLGPKEIQKIDFRNCNLTRFYSETFDGISVDFLDFRGNPLHCTCELYWLQAHQVALEYLANTRCASPPQVKGLSLADLDLKDGSLVPCDPSSASRDAWSTATCFAASNPNSVSGSSASSTSFYSSANQSGGLVLAVFLVLGTAIVVVLVAVVVRRCSSGYKRALVRPFFPPSTTHPPSFNGGTTGSRVRYQKPSVTMMTNDNAAFDVMADDDDDYTDSCVYSRAPPTTAKKAPPPPPNHVTTSEQPPLPPPPY